MSPPTLLADVTWSFHQPRFKDVTWLVKAVERFSREHRGTAPAWKPEAVLLTARHVRIRIAGTEHTLHPKQQSVTAAGLLFELHERARPALEHAADHYLVELALIEEAGLAPAMYELRTAYWLGLPEEQPRGPLPHEVLRDVAWSFMDTGAKERAAFVARVTATLAELDCEPWEPDAIVLPAPMILVAYDSPSFGDTHILPLRSEGRDGFTAGELLHRIHLACAPKLARHDHHFFEGLTLVAQPTATEPPAYRMLLGS